MVKTSSSYFHVVFYDLKCFKDLKLLLILKKAGANSWLNVTAEVVGMLNVIISHW